MNLERFLKLFLCTMGYLWAVSCVKNVTPDPVTPPPDSTLFYQKTILYRVKGTNFRLNYIDSVSVFKTQELFKDSFRYEFKRGPGAGIGISIFSNSQADTVFSWELYINNKLYANAFGPGGAYLTVPYD